MDGHCRQLTSIHISPINLDWVYIKYIISVHILAEQIIWHEKSVSPIKTAIITSILTTQQQTRRVNPARPFITKGY